MEFLGEVLDLCVELLGEVFVRWMQNLARANRRLYIGLFGLLLLLMYLLLGNPLYLGASLLTLLLAALGWKKPPVPRRLFE